MKRDIPSFEVPFSSLSHAVQQADLVLKAETNNYYDHYSLQMRDAEENAVADEKSLSWVSLLFSSIFLDLNWFVHSSASS